MRPAALMTTIGFGALMVYQAVLAAGAPLGEAAWGGSNSELTTAQRAGSALSVAFYALAIVVVRRRAAGRTQRRYRWGTWMLAAVMSLAALANLASASPWETYLLAPVALALAVLCAVVAHQPRAVQSRTTHGGVVVSDR